MADEASIIEGWLFSTLSGDTALAALATGGVYSMEAPQETSQPYVLYSLQAGSSVPNAGGKHDFGSDVYQVKGVVKRADLATVKGIADRIDALLAGVTASVSGGVLRSRHWQPVRYAEEVNGVRYSHGGALYRIWWSAA